MVLMGLGLAYAKVQPLRSWLWKRVPCSVESFSVSWHRPDDRGSRPKVETRFSYTVDGITHWGTSAFLVPNGRLEFPEAYALEAAFREGALTSCLVNPSRPDDAVLDHLDWNHAGAASFGLFFALLGFAAWRVVSLELRRLDLRFLPLLLSVAVLCFAGLWITLSGSVKALLTSGWKPVEATVEYSGERTSRSGGRHGGITTHADLVFRYSVDGKTYLANQLQPDGSGPSSSTSRSAFLTAHPSGSKVRCWVNPTNAAESVLSRSAGWNWLLSVVPLALLAAIFYAVRGILKRSDPAGARTVTSAKPHPNT